MDLFKLINSTAHTQLAIDNFKRVAEDNKNRTILNAIEGDYCSDISTKVEAKVEMMRAIAEAMENYRETMDSL